MEVAVNVSPSEETVWQNQNDIFMLFEKDRSVISKHINNIFKEEVLLENSLDVIISVGYRVKSKPVLHLENGQTRY